MEGRSDQERLATLEATSKSHEENIREIFCDIKDIKDNLLKRPSWSVLTIITSLVGVCSSLFVYIATNYR